MGVARPSGLYEVIHRKIDLLFEAEEPNDSALTKSLEKRPLFLSAILCRELLSSVPAASSG